MTGRPLCGTGNPDRAGREAAEPCKLRLRHQIPDAEKAARADYVLENTGDRDSLHAQVVALWQRLQKRVRREQHILQGRVF